MKILVGMVKGGIDLKLFHAMIKYNDIFVTNNLSGSVIGFMEDRPLAGRPWVFRIPRDKPLAWPEVEYVENAIKMQCHFGQEANNNTLYDTAGDPTKTRVKLPILVMVPYDMVEWLVKSNRTPNELRLWIEKQDNDDPKFHQYDWELVNKFGFAAGQVDVSDKNNIMLELYVEPVTAIDEGFWNRVEHRLGAMLGSKP